MLTLVLLLAVGQIQFLEQPLDEVRIGPITPLTGLPAVNYLHTDLNADGAMDLLTPEFAHIQVGGGYPDRARLAMPPCGGNTDADVFGATLLYRTQDHLKVFSYAEGAWITDLDQPIDWPGENPSYVPSSPLHGVAAFRRFTHDLNGDGTPELVGLDADGVHIFERGENGYQAAGLLRVLPEMTINRPAPQAIWPPEQRRVVLPEQQMACRVLFAGAELAIVTDSSAADGMTLYQRERYQLSREEGGQFTAMGTGTETSAELPPHVRPCHLNADAIQDFAGSRWSLSQSAAIPVPIHENWASLDNGKTFQIERAVSFPQFRPHAPFLDFDSDGDLDMIMESTTIFDDGVRETANQYLTRSKITHIVRIHKQENGSFAKQASLSCALDITLDAPPASPGAMLARYQTGELVNLSGDFNGDGFLDLVIRSASDRLLIRLAEGWDSFDEEPALVLTVPKTARASVADVNGDGLADLVLNDDVAPSGATNAGATVYFTREGSK